MAEQGSPSGKKRKRGLPRVLLVGRPNTGKSTLFNRITQTRQAIVYPTPGVTRDLHGDETDWNGRRFLLYDAAGLETQAVPGSIMAGAAAVLNDEAKRMDLIVVVVDARDGVTALDREAVQWARMQGKPLVLAVNKVEDARKADAWMADFYQLGIDPMVPTSGEHGQGVGDLLDLVVDRLPPPPKQEKAHRGTVLLLGRPNVGKSTLFNALLGRERVVVHATAGTTRDIVEEPLALPGGRVGILDAAGLVRGLINKEDIQFYSEQRVRQAVQDARLVLLCLHPAEGITHQDRAMFHDAVKRAQAVAVLLMQSDRVADEERHRIERMLTKKLFVQQAFPFHWVCGLDGQGVGKLRTKLDEWVSEPRPTVPPDTLKGLIERWRVLAPPPTVKGKRFQLKKLIMPQPSTFELHVTGLAKVPVSYARRLRRELLEELPVTAWVIRFKVRHPKPKA